MILHSKINDTEFRILLKQNKIRLGGNLKLKIYGTLKCKSGKRMKRSNRIFFQLEKEALEIGYRPCGHCLKPEYKKWKKANGFI